MSGRFYKYLLLLIAIILVALAWIVLRKNPVTAPWFGLQQSGSAFAVGNELVMTSYGYYGNGDRLAFAIILSWPEDMDPDLRLQDPRYDGNSGGVPLIRSPDGVMRYVKTDGHVYVFLGDELRVMHVTMNEHTDTVGLSRASSMEEIWRYLQQFRVND